MLEDIEMCVINARVYTLCVLMFQKKN